MSAQRRIRVIGKQRKEPDLKALAKAVIELARTLDEKPDGASDPVDEEPSK